MTKQGPQKILVVDDETIVRDVCERVLLSRGFDCIVAKTGIEGLQIYKERHPEICLVLSDVSMPLMDGIDMAREMFRVHGQANVILMSGYRMENLIAEDVRKLCSVIAKPFTPGRLMEAVKKCLKYDEEHHPGAAPEPRAA